MSNVIKRSGDILLSEGIFLIVIGLLMIYLSQTTTVILAFLLSIGLVFIGLYKIINSIIVRKELPVPILSVLAGIFLVIIGLYLVFHPVFNMLLLTIAAAFYFLLESINSFSAAISSKGFKQIFWVGLFSGLVQLLLAIIIILNLPFMSLWFIGMLLGVNFIIAGFTIISVYSYLKQLWTKYIS